MIIQLAKTGTHNDITISLQDLTDCVGNFNPNDRVPVIKGHDSAFWSDSLPADGWVNRVWLDGEYLIGDVELSEELQTAWDNGEYQNWSVGLSYDESKRQWYLHHLAFLGAVPPKIKGLQVIEMSDNKNNRIVRFSDLCVIDEQQSGVVKDDKDDKKTEDAEVTPEEAKRLKKEKEDADAKAADLEKQNKELSDKLNKQKKAKAKAEIKAFSDAAAGKMPKDHIGKIAQAATDALAGKTLLFSDVAENEEGKEEPVAGLLGVLIDALNAMPKLASDKQHQFPEKAQGITARIVTPGNKI